MAVRHFEKVMEPLPSWDGGASAILGVAHRSRDYSFGDVIWAWRHGERRGRSQAPPGGAGPVPVAAGGGGGHGQGLRPPLQAAADRGQRRGQDLPRHPLRRGQLQQHLHLHHRHRLQDPHCGYRWEEDQAAGLGHGGTGTLQNHHHGLLPRSRGHRPGVRHHGREILREHPELDEKHQGERLGRGGAAPPGQQVRHGGEEESAAGRGREAGQGPRDSLLRDQRQVQPERGGGFLHAGAGHPAQILQQSPPRQQQQGPAGARPPPEGRREMLPGVGARELPETPGAARAPLRRDPGGNLGGFGAAPLSPCAIKPRCALSRLRSVFDGGLEGMERGWDRDWHRIGIGDEIEMGTGTGIAVGTRIGIGDGIEVEIATGTGIGIAIGIGDGNDIDTVIGTVIRTGTRTGIAIGTGTRTGMSGSEAAPKPRPQHQTWILTTPITEPRLHLIRISPPLIKLKPRPS